MADSGVVPGLVADETERGVTASLPAASDEGQLVTVGDGAQAGSSAATGLSDIKDTPQLAEGEVAGRRGGRLRPVRTAEQARALAQRRWEKSEHVGRRALAAQAREAGADVEGVSDWAAGWFLVVKSEARKAMDGGRGSSQAAAFVRRAAGLERQAERVAGGGPMIPAGGALFGLSPELARYVLDRLGREADGGE